MVLRVTMADSPFRVLRPVSLAMFWANLKEMPAK